MAYSSFSRKARGVMDRLEPFNQYRPLLFAIAYRLLSSAIAYPQSMRCGLSHQVNLNHALSCDEVTS